MTVSSDRTLSGLSSLFLDSLRFMAALIVLITHARAIWFPEGELDQVPSNLSHGAVVVFFVLSGFVIAHTTTHSNRGPAAYAIARLSRLYSVFLPAMIITTICFLTLKSINPGIFNQYNQDQSGFRFLISVFFCNEIWFFSSAPLINGPIWSLSHEFWFYMIFGSIYYKRKGVKGLLIPAIMCVIAGPKILMLMFMWMLGWLVYQLPRPSITLSYTVTLIVCLLVAAGLTIFYLPSWPNYVNTTRLHWADKFLSDFLVSLIIAFIFYLLPNGDLIKIPDKIVSICRKISDLTFPIYVLHFPLLVMSRALLTGIDQPYSQFIISLISVFTICTVLGFFLESKRRIWDDLFKRIFNVLSIHSLK